MPIILNGTTFTNGGDAIYNGGGRPVHLTSIRFGNTEVWRKETTETGTLTVKGHSEAEGNIQWEYGWYEKSFDIPTGTTFRLNDFYFESNGTPIWYGVEIYVNGTKVSEVSQSQGYTYNSGAFPSASGTYTSTQNTNTLRLRARIAINAAIFTGDYYKDFKYSVFKS